VSRGGRQAVLVDPKEVFRIVLRFHDEIVSTLQQSLRGRLIGPSDADYDAARALYNGMIDKRPRLIARCVDVADVIVADVVLANGSFVTTSKSQHPDLFWALRGGGGNFGVVTSFLFQAHPVGTVYAGPIFWEATHVRP
jgi:hypothetical protein